MRGTDVEQALSEEVERLYRRAKGGKWDAVWMHLAGDHVLAGACSRYVQPDSKWTFLHQAAYSANDGAARTLLRLGASLRALSSASETPRDVAAKRGHVTLAAMLDEAERGADGPWEPTADPELLPSSCAWHERQERRAWRELRVGFGGKCVVIPAGGRYFVDVFERVLVAPPGVYNPPDAGGAPIVVDLRVWTGERIAKLAPAYDGRWTDLPPSLSTHELNALAHTVNGYELAQEHLRRDAFDVLQDLEQQTAKLGTYDGTAIELLVAFFADVRGWRGLYEGPEEGDQSHRTALAWYHRLLERLRERPWELQFRPAPE